MRKNAYGGSKGQISIDYLSAIVVLGVLGLAIYQAFGDSDSRVWAFMEKSRMQSIASQLAAAIDDVVVMGDGSQKTVTLPETTPSGKEYSVIFRGNMLLIRWPGSDWAERFTTAEVKVINAGSKGLNATALLPGRILITNVNGEINLQNVLETYS